MEIDPRVLEDEMRAEQEVESADVEDDAAVDGMGAAEAEVDEGDACGLIPENAVPPEDVVVPEAGNVVRVASLGGAGLLFGRSGGAPRPTSFPVDADFRALLESTVTLVTRRAPRQFGKLESLTSAGVLVVKPGMHKLGRACDWDAWTFSEVAISPIRRHHADPSPAKRRRYWALAALCRSRSNFVLHAEFNAAHHDHIHQDNGGGSVAFSSGSQSTVKLVQAVCNEIFDCEPRLSVDGSFGTNTQEAVTAALETLQMSGTLTDLGTWRQFLRRSGRLGFRLSV